MIDTRAEEHHHPETDCSIYDATGHLSGAHESWTDKAAKEHYNFRVQLETAALRDLLDDVERLKQLRYDVEQLDRYKKMFRHALFEMNVDLDKTVLKASEPNWDSERGEELRSYPLVADEQKHGGDDLQALRAKRLARFDSSENK